jgi:hypothetical protein
MGKGILLTLMLLTFCQCWSLTTDVNDDLSSPIEAPQRNYYVTTNGVAWLMGVSNVGFQMDINKQWSVYLPIYYSGWNYFSSDVKFRCSSFYPEVRYRFQPEAPRSWFAGLHLGIAYYNFAFGGKYRYQDYDQRHPALGGGVTVGYRMPLGKSGRWHISYEAGLGAYYLKYEKIPLSGHVVEQIVEKAFFGLDNLAVTVSYSLTK